MFSVVIPLYNKELSIENTLQSVLHQTYQQFEIVVINDGSTDASVAKVEAFNDPRIRLIHKQNDGVSSARNRGICEAKYAWIAFLDADDLWMVNHLETIYQAIQKHPSESVFSNSYIRSDETFPENKDETISVIHDYFTETLKKPFFWTSIACIHQKVFKEVGLFNEELTSGEDLNLWTRIARKYNFVKSHKITAIYRVEAENRSDLSFNMLKNHAYHYDFKEATSPSEIFYYRKHIGRAIKQFLLEKDFNNFYLLLKKHRHNIRFSDIFALITKNVKNKIIYKQALAD
jgi:glycosyltransferase involved in cell wall biosynthesis